MHLRHNRRLMIIGSVETSSSYTFSANCAVGSGALACFRACCCSNAEKNKGNAVIKAVLLSVTGPFDILMALAQHRLEASCRNWKRGVLGQVEGRHFAQINTGMEDAHCEAAGATILVDGCTGQKSLGPSSCLCAQECRSKALPSAIPISFCSKGLASAVRRQCLDLWATSET